MQLSMLYMAVVLIQGTVLGAGNPCSPGSKVADDCFGITFEGCCTDDKAVRWCEGGVLCEISCANKPACGWKSGAGVYDCAAIPQSDPTCENPYSCLVGGCAPAYEDEGCCDCPCQPCVCSKDPYCCQVSWDPVCVKKCRECGGCGSTDGCTAAPTPGCSGCACEACVCQLDDFCCTGKWDSMCAGLCATQCDGGCDICQPDCNGKDCGSDGCLGICGVCPANAECTQGKCVPICEPDCTGLACGMDPCGKKNCGTCPADHECKYGKCIPPPCVPDCEGKECGSDGCNGKCGTCEVDVACIDGVCTPGACAPECDGKDCGEDGCGDFCGFCPPTYACNFDLGKCYQPCKPNCVGKECGDDGCDGQCGICAAGLSCEEGEGGTLTCKAPCFPMCEGKACGDDFCGGSCGECVAPTPYCVEAMGSICMADCIPDCLGQECGSDGCGGECGACPAGWLCQSGMCVPSCSPQCLVPPAYLIYKQCGWDQCEGAQNVCGVCTPGFYCAPGYICVEDTCSCEGKQCGQPAPECPPCGPLNGDCPEGEGCDPFTFLCIPCQPDCMTEQGQLKQCGDNGCGGSCGECQEKWVCDEDPNDGDLFYFQCEPCQPNCFNGNGSFKVCGSDGCGGDCGTCPLGTECDETVDPVTCSQCVPKCMLPPELIWPMECGPNQCPAGCMDVGIKPCVIASDCEAGQQCNAETGMCVECGSCGFCPPGYVCDVETVIDPKIYVCVPCTPNCSGKECGDNGCGGSCGTCPAGWNCEDGVCVKPCTPTAGCFGKECGPNGCPHGCMEPEPEPCVDGLCPANMECNVGTQMCEVLECGKFGECPAGAICDPDQNVCTTCGKCMDCVEGEYCAPGYVCMTKPATDVCEDNQWECGPDGEGGSCGDCGDDENCEDHECVAGSAPDVIEDTDAGEDDAGTTPGKDTPEPEKDVGGGCGECVFGECVAGQCECWPGYHKFFGMCQPDEEEEKKKDEGGCACNIYARGNHPGTGALLVLLFSLALFLAARRRSGRCRP